MVHATTVEDVRTGAVQNAGHGECVLRIGDPIDLPEQVDQRRSAQPIGFGAVHAGGPEVADLLLVGAVGGIGLGGFLVDAAGLLPQFLHDQVADAPGGFGAGDRVGLDPASVGEIEEVVTGVHRAVDVGGEEVGARRGLRLLGVGGGAASGEEQQDGEGKMVVHGAKVLGVSLSRSGHGVLKASYGIPLSVRYVRHSVRDTGRSYLRGPKQSP